MDRLPEHDLYRFWYPIRVRYRDIDTQAIVFNGNYLSYIDTGIMEYWRHLGFTYADMVAAGFDMAMVRSVQEFRGPAYLDDVLRIYVKAVSMGTTSFTMRYQIRRDTAATGLVDATVGVVSAPVQPAGELVLVCENVYVNYDAQARKARPVTAAIRQVVQHFDRLPSPSGA